LYAKWTAISSGGSGGSSGGGSSKPTETPSKTTSPENEIVLPEEESEPAEVEGETKGMAIQINDEDLHDAAIASTEEEKGVKTTLVVLDTEKITENLDAIKTGTTVTVPVNEKTDTTVVQLDGKLAKVMEYAQAVLEIKTEVADYKLPVKQINIDLIIEKFGENVDLSDININIEISKLSEEEVKIVEDAASKGNYTLIVPPVSFTITCTYKGNNIEVSEFSSYVERLIAIPDGVDHEKITTAIIVEKDGTVRHVPTKAIIRNGRHYTQVNSMANSVYTLICNQVKFKDLVNHWAEEAVNDMGSRLIVSGIGEGIFAPDRDVTRAEFAAIIVRALGLKPESGKPI